MKRRHLNQATFVTLASSFGLDCVRAQSSYPSKLITLVVAYSSGGSTEQHARQMGRFFSDAFGQPVVIARAKPDGYTHKGCSSNDHESYHH